ncbi:MAG TPA: sugar nucleotide-binding protein [Alphaproteobacteria bacterium]|nr:sugar nucleotide-binding protein [Alphaproteobacteria bacterium]
MARADRTGAVRDDLIVGGDSLIGRSLGSTLSRAGRPFQATSRRAQAGALPLDLAAPAFAAFDGLAFGCAYICAAVTDLRACERDPEATARVNVEGTLAVMRMLAARGTELVFLSSSQVFDGETPLPDEEAACRPKNAYGRQKLALEAAIAREGLPAAVLRPTKVLAAEPVGMFRLWYEKLRRGEPAVAASDMTLAPVAAEEVAGAAIALGDRRCRGIWHLSSADELSYAEAAAMMAEACGFPPGLVRGEAVPEASVPAIFRHRCSALDARKIAHELGLPIRPARAVLRQLFADFPTAAG